MSDIQAKIIDADAIIIDMKMEQSVDQLPAKIDVDRLARIEPEITEHVVGDDRLVNALAELDDPARTAAVLRLSERQAVVSRSLQVHEGKQQRGMLEDSMLSHFWRSMGGKKRIIAVKEGKAFNLFSTIKRVEVWECRDQRWRGYAWEGHKRVDIVETFPHDYPLHEALGGYEIIQGVHKVDKAAPLLDVRLTTADHALHDLQRPGCGVRTFRQFLKIYNAHVMQRRAEAEVENKSRLAQLEDKGEKKSTWRTVRWMVGVPAAALILILMFA